MNLFLWLISNPNIIIVSNQDARREMRGIHHLRSLRVGSARCHIFYSAGSCKLLLNNQSLIDRKRMCCHFAGATVTNTFFILYMLQAIIVSLAPIPPRCSEYVLKWNVVSCTTLPKGEQNTRTIGSLEAERRQTKRWLKQSQRRDTQSVKEEHRWKDRRDRGKTKGRHTNTHTT